MLVHASKENKKLHGFEEEEPIIVTMISCLLAVLKSTINSVHKMNECYKTLTIKNKSVQSQLDTEAKCNTISTKVYKSLENVPNCLS